MRVVKYLTWIAWVVMVTGAGTETCWAGGDPAAGKVVFDTICRRCHAALPYTGRVGDRLAAFLANPRRVNPKTAMTFPGLRSKKQIDDVIAYITSAH